MALPVEITFRNLDLQPAVEAVARDLADELRRLVPSILGCAVQVEPGFRVRVTVGVPENGAITGAARADRLVDAVRGAFRGARRALVELSHRAQLSPAAAPASGRVLAVSRSHGFGVIEADDGHHVFFDAKTVRGGLDQLRAGSRVRFAADPGAPRLQAAMVIAAVG